MKMNKANKLKHYYSGKIVFQCRIRDWPLLIKCGLVLSTVIILFFLHSIPQLNLSMGWTALLGAVLLLILADPKGTDFSNCLYYCPL